MTSISARTASATGTTERTSKVKAGSIEQKFMERQWVVAIHQQISSPIAHAYHEELDLKIGGRLPLPKNLEDSRLSLLVFGGRTLWAFVPADHVLHRILP